MTMLYSKPKRLSAWQRYAIFVGCMALVYGMGVMALRAAIMPVLQESPGRINSKAPSLQFGIGGPKQSTRHMQSPARHKPWVEIVSGASADEPRIFIVHNLLSDAECDHLISLALKKGLKSSLITPYGSHDLVESTTRTNKQAWLEYGEDDIVKGIEERIAKLTKTYPEQGENLQVLHYDKGQQFTEHHDYFDPATDPPENYEKGGNRLLTLIMYLEAAQEGGETEFFDINRKVVLARGDAVMFYNLKHGCDGINPTCVDSMTRLVYMCNTKMTRHAGRPPIKGEKWVATKWIHERAYQNAVPSNQVGCFDKHPRCHEWAQRSPSECKVNPTWMKNNCHLSCKYCARGDTGYLK